MEKCPKCGKTIYFDNLTSVQKKRQVVIDALECFKDDIDLAFKESDNSGYDSILAEESEILEEMLKKLKAKQPGGVRPFWVD